jgi:arginyl-tRNA synthetase
MHVGHARGAVFGDALANLLAFAGRNVTREYYVNDAGAQVDVLARSAFLRYREALGETIAAIPEGLYPGDYLKPVGEALAREFGASLRDRREAEWLAPVRSRAIAAMMAMIKDDLAALNITHEVFASERALTGADGGPDLVLEAIEDLRRRGIVYQGRLPPPKGQPSEDWEDREQLLFHSTDFGDDIDRPLVKSDGGYTYFASDIAYHKTKIDRGYLSLVDVWGADHGGYVKRMQAAVAALSAGKASLDVRLCQLVRLMRAGEPVKMSKRSGDFVTLREVVDEVGADAVRFIMLMRKNDATLDFDLAKVIERSQDNPVFYVQYAHARACSVLRQARVAFPAANFSAGALAQADFSLLADEGERGLMRALANYPRVASQAAEAHEPHRIAFYAHDLATLFHAQWNRGKDLPHLRYVNEGSTSLTYSRLGLVIATSSVLASALTILGVSAPEEMR